MPLGEYVTGALFYIPTLGAALGAAYLIVRRHYRHLPALPRILALMVLGTAAVVFVHVLPAALGILSRSTALVAALALLAAAWLSPRPARAPAPEPQPAPPPSGAASTAIAVLAVGAVVIYELARLRGLISQPLTDIDMLGFHVPGVARWIQSGSLWRVDQFEPGFATAQYPNNGDFLMLSVILPWRDLAFVRLVPLPFYALTGVGVYALATELRATRAAAATMAAAVITVPAFSLLALDGLPDAVALATLVTGVLFLLRHGRSGAPAELVLAGLALGLSFGTKWYGATSAAAIVAVWIIAKLLARQSLRRVARQAAALLGMILLGGGFWLVRNLAESGNPIYPKAVSALGLGLFQGSHGDVIDRYGYAVADYLGAPHVLGTYIYPGFRARVGVTGAVLLGALILAAVMAGTRLRRRAGEPRRTAAAVLGLVAVALGICALYMITPGSAYGPKNLPVEGFVNIRWMMPAVAIAAAVAAWAATSLGRAAIVLELGGLVGVIDGIRLNPGVAASTVVKAGLVVGVLLLVGLAIRRWISACGEQQQRPAFANRPLLAAGLALAVCLAILAAGRIDQRNFDRRSYAPYDATFAWIEANAPQGHRVGLTGIWDTSGLSPVLPAFGPRLGNVVAYVGDPVRHSLHVPGSRNSLDSELRRGRYDLLLIGLRQTGGTQAWARAAGYRLLALSGRLALYGSGTPGA